MQKNFKKIFQSQISAIKEAGTFQNERIIVSPQAASIKVAPSTPVINFCANNYLGLSSNQGKLNMTLEIINAASEALKKYGSGLSSVRFICGTTDLHKALESKISKFHEMEDTILYP